MSDQHLAPASSAEAVNPWSFEEAARKAEERLRAIPLDQLGPAGRTLLGVTNECPTCSGTGKVALHVRA